MLSHYRYLKSVLYTTHLPLSGWGEKWKEKKSNKAKKKKSAEKKLQLERIESKRIEIESYKLNLLTIKLFRPTNKTAACCIPEFINRPHLTKLNSEFQTGDNIYVHSHHKITFA